MYLTGQVLMAAWWLPTVMLQVVLVLGVRAFAWLVVSEDLCVIASLFHQ